MTLTPAEQQRIAEIQTQSEWVSARLQLKLIVNCRNPAPCSYCERAAADIEAHVDAVPYLLAVIARLTQQEETS